MSVAGVLRADIIEKINAVIQDMHRGNSMREALKKYGLDNQSFFEAIFDNSTLDAKYRTAQRARSELFVEDLIDISDTDEDPIRAKNKIATRKWYASKMSPDRYGDKIELKVEGQIDLKAALAEAEDRLKIRIAQSRVIPNDRIAVIDIFA